MGGFIRAKKSAAWGQTAEAEATYAPGDIQDAQSQERAAVKQGEGAPAGGAPDRCAGLPQTRGRKQAPVLISGKLIKHSNRNIYTSEVQSSAYVDDI